jgi:hypothetical protein
MLLVPTHELISLPISDDFFDPSVFEGPDSMAPPVLLVLPLPLDWDFPASAVEPAESAPFEVPGS